MKPRILLVGRTRYRLPLDESLRRKFDALANVADMRVIGSAPPNAPRGDVTFRLVPPFPVHKLDGLLYHALLPLRVAQEVRGFRPDVVLVQGAHEAAFTLLGRALARSRAPLVLDVHGDWRTATRLYGSRARRALNPLADRLALLAVRRADAVRTVSNFTTGLVRDAGVEPAATFPAFMDLDPFLIPSTPLPAKPAALFVGVLERYKGIDVLAAAWPDVEAQVPDAELRIVGRGSRADVVERLLGKAERVSWQPELTTEGVARALDEATCLVLPSRREGMGRVVVEALCRSRPVVGSDSGGIRDLVRDGENGLLAPEGDAAALAEALRRVLSERDLAERLASRARPSVEDFLATPEKFAEQIRALVAALN